MKAWEDFHLEKVNQRACRLLMSVQKKTSRLALLGELGRYPVIFKSLVQSIMYKRSIEKYQSSSLVGQALQEMHEQNVSTSWLGRVKSITQLVGIPEYPQYWSDERVRRNILTIFQSKFDIFFKDEISSENVRDDGVDHSKLRFYKTFKSCFRPEHYVENINNRNQRAWLCRLRTSSHRLEVERGRYGGILYCDRRCRYCPEEDIDTEIHFLHDCSIANQERAKFFAEMGTIIPNFDSLNVIDKVKTILCPATNQAAKLANRFIGTMFKERENIDKGVNLQEDQMNISDSDEAFQSESSEDEI